MDRFKDRVAVVTGAGSGIGRALALALAGRGCKIVLADVEAKPLGEAEDAVKAIGVETLAIETDVGNAESMAALATATIVRFGATHILCNNAGVGGGGLIKNQQLVDWKWLIDVNLWGVIHGLQYFLPHLIQADEAHIVSTASVAGLYSLPGLGPYNATKYGVVAIMETLYVEMAQDNESNIDVSVLCPGVVNTNIASAHRNRPQSLRRERTSPSNSEENRNRDEAGKRNAAIAAALEAGKDPAEIAEMVMEAVAERRFWILSHEEHLQDVRERNEALHGLVNPIPPREIF